MTLINDRDKIEADEMTSNPIFLVQLRKLVFDQVATDSLHNEYALVDGNVYEKDAYQSARYKSRHGDDEELDNLEPISEDQLFSEGYGTWVWETQSVAYTREEGERESNKWGNDGRTYCVPAIGNLAKILRGRDIVNEHDLLIYQDEPLRMHPLYDDYRQHTHYGLREFNVVETGDELNKITRLTHKYEKELVYVCQRLPSETKPYTERIYIENGMCRIYRVHHPFFVAPYKIAEKYIDDVLGKFEATFMKKRHPETYQGHTYNFSSHLKHIANYNVHAVFVDFTDKLREVCRGGSDDDGYSVYDLTIKYDLQENPDPRRPSKKRPLLIEIPCEPPDEVDLYENISFRLWDIGGKAQFLVGKTGNRNTYAFIMTDWQRRM